MKYIIILFIAMPSFAKTLDLTIPEQPAAKYERVTFFNTSYYREPPTKAQVITFWTLQALDVYTTHQALKTPGTYEQNPLLGKSPSLEQLILFKAITGKLAVDHINKNQMHAANAILGIAAYNNYQLID